MQNEPEVKQEETEAPVLPDDSVIAAQPGYYVVTVDTDDKEDPIDTRWPVVAWRITYDDDKPAGRVIAITLFGEEPYDSIIEQPDGRFINPDDGWTSDNLNELVAYERKQEEALVQGNIDRRVKRIVDGN